MRRIHRQKKFNTSTSSRKAGRAGLPGLRALCVKHCSVSSVPTVPEMRSICVLVTCLALWCSPAACGFFDNVGNDIKNIFGGSSSGNTAPSPAAAADAALGGTFVQLRISTHTLQVHIPLQTDSFSDFPAGQAELAFVDRWLSLL